MQKISSTSPHHPLHHRRRVISLPLGTVRFLAAFEGVEGGFAIGASIVAGLGIAGFERHLLLVTAIITLIVNGFNSASVKYSSEHYLDELDGREKQSPFRHYFIPAFIEFFCYVLLSVISVLPLLVIDNVTLAVVLSVSFTVVLLFLAGVWRGFLLRANGLRDGIETVILGVGIIIVGVIGGLLAHSL